MAALTDADKVIRNDTGIAIANAIQALSGNSNMADAYDDTATYAVGDLCIYNNTLYKAKQATTGNLPTNTTYWEQTSIADEIGTKVSKNGDTITGAIVRATDIDTSTIPTQSKTYNAIEFNDSSDNQLCRLETYQTSNTGIIRVQICVTRGNDLNYLYLGIKPNGDKEVYVSDDGAWRIALKVPQKLGNSAYSCNTMVSNFTNGVVNIPFSTLGLTDKPNCILLTPARDDVAMSYDWDNSSSTNGIKITCKRTDGVGITGNVRYSIAILG